MKKALKISVVITLASTLLLLCLYRFNFISHKKYSSNYFGIEVYVSQNDEDGDGVNDQTDIMNSAREYLETKPKYKSKYYAGGYPDDKFGTCVDVVAFGLKGAGYDLMDLVNQDIENNNENYNIDIVDKNIDFRRVDNLRIFFENNASKLTTDISKIGEWQGGDIVIFENHIGIVSDNRNKNGVPFVLHHISPFQRFYEEDILEYRDDIVGHYRMEL